jgi:hypothetical protein
MKTLILLACILTTACSKYKLTEITDARGQRMTLRINTWTGHADRLDNVQCIATNIDPFYYWQPIDDDGGKKALETRNVWEHADNTRQAFQTTNTATKP